jgi:uncharacterized Rmd1/YagE family protein
MILKAYNIPSKIKFKEVVNLFKYEKVLQNGYEVVFKISQKRFMVLYSFGALVLINGSDESEFYIKDKLKSLMPDLDKNPETYEVVFKKDAKLTVDNNRAILQEFALEPLKIIALVLAESVSLEYFENQTELMLAQASEYSNQLKLKGVFPTNHKKLLQFIGFAINTKEYVLSNLYIVDKPEETWESPLLESLFLKMRDQFDIGSRFKSLNLSLGAIQDSVEIMANLVHVRRATIMELWIIALISFEILWGFIK